MKAGSLRLGIILRGDEIPFWVVEGLQLIKQMPFVSLEWCACRERPARRDRALKSWAWRSFLTADSFRSRRYRNRVRAHSGMIGAPLFILPEGAPIPKLAEDGEGAVDLIINLSGERLPAKESSRFSSGEWFVRLGSVENDLYLTAGFLEVANHVGSSSAAVISCHGVSSRELVKLPVRTHRTSPFINHCLIERAGVAAVVMLLLKGSRIEQREASQCLPSSLRPEESVTPSGAEFLRLIGGAAFKSMRGYLSRRRTPQWSIGLLDHGLKERSDRSVDGAVWYHPDPHHFIADPFILSHNGQNMVLVEDYDYEKKRGHISVMEIEQNGKISHPVPVLERDFHLSFPFAFEHQKRFFMIPEQASTGKVVLYESPTPKGPWVERKVLLHNFPGVDNVLFFHNARWWLFTSFGALGAHDSNLHLFMSDDFLSAPFIPHPKNPLMFTLRGSRMGGQIWQDRGRLYRPGQDCSEHYGGSLVIYEVIELSPTNYVESEVAVIGPSASGEFAERCHTINSTNNLTAITGMRYI